MSPGAVRLERAVEGCLKVDMTRKHGALIALQLEWCRALSILQGVCTGSLMPLQDGPAGGVHVRGDRARPGEWLLAAGHGRVPVVREWSDLNLKTRPQRHPAH
mmetsp:Transcript_45517/g.93114  ORF Transcript_45517/g.93114 Transcript_45517/m.93114 type:complete len:103 (-) Transcript_45517:2539-2847(-)